MGRLSGKVAVITGGASGMGAATVRRFVGEGARVVIADLQVDKGEAIAEECGDATAFIATDVGVEADIAALIACAVDRFGRLDCLFNNAGFGGVSGTIDETDMGEAYTRTVAGLLTGPVLGMKHAAPVMKAQGSGSIVSTASVAGLRGGMGPHVYSALKAAVIGLTRSVAVELAPSGVRVNAICPGGIMTPIFLGGRKLKAGANASLEDVLERDAARPARRHRQGHCGHGLVPRERRLDVRHGPGARGRRRPDGWPAQTGRCRAQAGLAGAAGVGGGGLTGVRVRWNADVHVRIPAWWKVHLRAGRPAHLEGRSPAGAH